MPFLQHHVPASGFLFDITSAAASHVPASGFLFDITSAAASLGSSALPVMLHEEHMVSFLGQLYIVFAAFLGRFPVVMTYSMSCRNH